MKKTRLVSILSVFIFLSISTVTIAQNKIYSTKTGEASFDAGTGAEDITGKNKSVLSAFNPATGALQFSVLIKGFEFWSELLQEHFNENYMESSKYPKSTFKGNITNIEKLNVNKDGSYPVNVKGTLEIHGVKKEVTTSGTMKVKGENINATAEFVVVLEDYNIQIPGVVKDKLSKTAKIKINCDYSIQK
jgi:hypothetical protein